MTAHSGTHQDVALRTASGFLRGLLDPEERQAVALAAAWEAETKLLPRRYVPTVTRRRLVEAVRTKHGRDGRRRLTEPLDDIQAHPAVLDRYPSDGGVDDLIQDLAGDDARLALVFRLISEGYTKTQAAQAIGVHPSRVSQLLRQVRDRAAELEGTPS